MVPEEFVAVKFEGGSGGRFFLSNLKETKEPEQPTEKSATIIEKIVDNLDEMRYSTEVKEELDQIEALRKEFEQYKTALQNQVTKGLATSSGGGEVRLEFLDDVDRDTAKVDGKFLKFDSSSGKFVGDDASVSNETIQDVVGNMVSSNTESGITVTYQDADGTLDFTIGALNQDTTGNAATATALETARNIGGVSFDGTANINLPGVNTSGDKTPLETQQQQPHYRQQELFMVYHLMVLEI